jgi:hypothetical protein
MNIPDLVNGLFEVFGGIAIWLNVKAILKDREVKGINWLTTVFFTTWGFWNLYYYPSLDQWASFWGGLVIVSGNSAWIYLVIKYKWQERKRIKANSNHSVLDWKDKSEIS